MECVLNITALNAINCGGKEVLDFLHTLEVRQVDVQPIGDNLPKETRYVIEIIEVSEVAFMLNHGYEFRKSKYKKPYQYLCKDVR